MAGERSLDDCNGSIWFGKRLSRLLEDEISNLRGVESICDPSGLYCPPHTFPASESREADVWCRRPHRVLEYRMYLLASHTQATTRSMVTEFDNRLASHVYKVCSAKTIRS